MVHIYQRHDGTFELALALDVVPEGVAVGENVVAIGHSSKVDVYERIEGSWGLQHDIGGASTPMWINGPQLVTASASSVTVRPWDTDDHVQVSSVSREDTDSTATCATFAESAAMSQLGLLIGGCDEVLVFQ